jgi:uncharacterized membrane protein YcaP (DUF421 family)
MTWESIMAAIFIRTILIYLLLIGAMRFSGKRQIGEIQLSELVTTILLSEIASYPLTNANIPFLYSVVPIVVIISLEIIMSFLATKSAAIKSILDGKPSIIIRKGVINQEEMMKMRLSMDDLLCELRLKNIASPDEVEYAILEQNGQISVFPKDSGKQVTLSDLKLTGDGAGVSHSVIIDGHIMDYALKNTGKSQEWVEEQLRKRHISDMKNVFLMTVNDKDDIKIVKKER